MAVLDINQIKSQIQTALVDNNTTTSTVLDLSSNLSTRVKQVVKLNPEKIPLDVNIYPCVTIFTDSKRITETTIAASQPNGKRRADLNLTVAGIVWNDSTTDFKEDSADNDCEYLMENIEQILRSYTTLGGYANWQFPTDVTYQSYPYSEDAHMRVGMMNLQVSVFY